MLMRMMVTRSENHTLVTAVEGAATLAAAGHLADGYALLLAGLRRVEAIRDDGQTGADMLVRRYGLAMENYTDAYGIPTCW
jgi:hypothetical protein